MGSPATSVDATRSGTTNRFQVKGTVTRGLRLPLSVLPCPPTTTEYAATLTLGVVGKHLSGSQGGIL